MAFVIPLPHGPDIDIMIRIAHTNSENLAGCQSNLGLDPLISCRRTGL
jgi:hypothetical protein